MIQKTDDGSVRVEVASKGAWQIFENLRATKFRRVDIKGQI